MKNIILAFIGIVIVNSSLANAARVLTVEIPDGEFTSCVVRTSYGDQGTGRTQVIDGVDRFGEVLLYESSFAAKSSVHNLKQELYYVAKELVKQNVCPNELNYWVSVNEIIRK